MARVPAALTVPRASFLLYPRLTISGTATLPIMAAVALLEPEMAPIPALVRTEA